MPETFLTLEKRVRKNAPPEKCKIVSAVADPIWLAQWSTLFWADDVNTEVRKAAMWTHEIAESDEPGRLPTKRGLRAFLGRWIRKDCRLKPQVRMVQQEPEPKSEVPRETVSTYLQQMKERVGR